MSEPAHDLLQIADWRARLAAVIDACDMVQAEPVHEAVRARFRADGMLAELHIDPDAPRRYPNTDLQRILADVLRTTRQRVYREVQAHATSSFAVCVRPDPTGTGWSDSDEAQALWAQLEGAANQVLAWLAEPAGGGRGAGDTRIYAESSRDGVLALGLDGAGAARWCRLGPEVNQRAADVLAHRVVRLYTLALLRVRCAERSRIAERFGPELAADVFSKAPAAYPDKRAVKRYRQQWIDF
jgi:hypothetical protein